MNGATRFKGVVGLSGGGGGAQLYARGQAAGRLLGRLRPAPAEIREALKHVSGLRDKPAGRVRLPVPLLAVSTVLAPRLGEIACKYPDIVLEVTTDDSRMDIVAAAFDAGIHFGEYIEKDTVAVRVSADLKPVIVGSSGYLELQGKAREGSRIDFMFREV